MPHGDLYAIRKNGRLVGWFAPLPNDTFLVVIPRFIQDDPIQYRYAIATRSHFETLTAGCEFQPETRVEPGWS